MQEDKDLLKGLTVEDKNLVKGRRALEEGKINPFNDDHEDVKKQLANGLTNIEEGAALTPSFKRSPEYHKLIDELKKKYEPRIEAAEAEFKAFRDAHLDAGKDVVNAKVLIPFCNLSSVFILFN